MPSYAVIFRTHVWDDDVAEIARRAQACCATGTFVVAADETKGRLDCDGFTKLSHCKDFTALGLPLVPDGNVLWWNADYVLYAARLALPGRDYYVMLEYDVLLNADLDQMVAQCGENHVGFVAQDIQPVGTHWSAASASEMGVELWWALIPFVIVSGRVVDVMLKARQLLANALTAGRITHWPYCEAFMPSAAALLPGSANWPLSRLVDSHLLKYRPFIRLRDARLAEAGIVAHPVMGSVRYIRHILADKPLEGHRMTDGILCAELQNERQEDLQAAFGDDMVVQKTPQGEWAIAAQLPEIIRPWVDLANGKPATQSSHSVWSRGVSAEADAAFANRDPLQDDYAFHTDREENPWWQVDLGEIAAVERIEIINRAGNAHHFTRFRIDASCDGVAWETCFEKQDNAIVSSNPARPARVELEPQVRARYIRIVQLGLEVMHLRRIRVLGFPLRPSEDATAPAPKPAGRLIDERADREMLAETVEALVHQTMFGRGFDSYDLDKLAFFAAGIEASQYAVAHMAKARRFSDAGALQDYAVDRAPAAGLVLEFGVFSGTSINRIASRVGDRLVFGFDSFEGLPETWRPGFEQGAFRRVGLPEVAKNVELVVGWFEDTLPGFIAAHPNETLSLLHVDCDLYSSTKTVFAMLAGRIVPGTIILFDEYFNYPEWRSHEHKAFAEFVAEHRIAYEYIGLVPSHQQVAVRVTRIG